jgi:AGZA family xanthine/uracil permease-like MFS transporter
MFGIKSRGSTVGREVIGGVTTFMAMSYILFVQPAVLSKAGMDSGGVFMATCISSAMACVLMGLWANYPIALAPGMGENFFFVFTLCGVGAASGVFKLTWQEGLALTAIAGALFLALSLVGFRARILNAIPDSLKSGIAAGIGMFIALIGFEWGNLIESDPATFLKLAKMDGNWVALIMLIGLATTFTLVAFRIRGAILIGILIATAVAWGAGKIWPREPLGLEMQAAANGVEVVAIADTSPVRRAGLIKPADVIVKFDRYKVSSSQDVLDAWRATGARRVVKIELVRDGRELSVSQPLGIATIGFKGIIGRPEGLRKTAGGFYYGFESLFKKLLSPNWVNVLTFGFIVLFMDLFDTVGTLVGVAGRAGLVKSGQLPRAERALAADATGTIMGACLGSSTVTSYIESVAGVQAGARTGLSAIVAGICMLGALFLQPLVEVVGGGVIAGRYETGDWILRYPMLAPALIVVGAMMMRAMRDVDWDDMTEALPGFLTMAVMPFAYSISAGIAAGFISYAVGKIVTGRFRQCPVIVYVFAALFIFQYAFMF